MFYIENILTNKIIRLGGGFGSVAGGTSPSDLYKDHCNKTIDIYQDVTSPEVTDANRNRPLFCTYRFRSFRTAPRDWVLRLRFKRFKVGTLVNATHCEGGFLQVTYTSHLSLVIILACICLNILQLLLV